MCNIKTFHATVPGESHIATGKECQDYSLTYEDPVNPTYICVVSDGHGGASYFRSGIGSRLAVEVTIEAIKSFIAETPVELLNVPHVNVKAHSSFIANNEIHDFSKQELLFHQLFSFIIGKWNDAIYKDWTDRPVSSEELIKMKVPEQQARAFQNSDKIEKAYGCTLIAYAQTQDYWFGFQIGDGKCISFKENGAWNEPIPWDEQCFLNKTTSMCDRKAIDNFRLCYGNTEKPVALFIGSDGIDDSFGNAENLVSFYVTIIKLFVQNKFEDALNEIKNYLPKLSKSGSQDDMSIAGVLNLDLMPAILNKLLSSQVDFLKKNKTAIEDLLEQTNKKRVELNDKINLLKTQKTECNNSIKQEEEDITKVHQEKHEHEQKIENFKKALSEKQEAVKRICSFLIKKTDLLTEKKKECDGKERELQKFESEYKMENADYERKSKELQEIQKKIESIELELNTKITN